MVILYTLFILCHTHSALQRTAVHQLLRLGCKLQEQFDPSLKCSYRVLSKDVTAGAVAAVAVLLALTLNNAPVWAMCLKRHAT